MQQNQMYQELIELLTTDAASGKEAAVADKLVDKLRSLGLQVTRDCAGEGFGGECGNVIGVLEGQLDDALLLSAHMDRVPNGLGIRPVETDGILHSSGDTILAADDIAGVCAILDGLRRVIASGKPLPRIEVLFSVGEEIGLQGAKGTDLSAFRAKNGFVFDSPGRIGRFVNAAPGICHLNVEITGRSAHAGNEPEKGINAAKVMCDILSTLRQGRLDEQSTANFPILSTQTTARNVVCDSASFRGEARSRDAALLDAYLTYFEEHCRKTAQAAGAGIHITVQKNYPPFRIAPESRVLTTARAACEALGLPFRVEAGGGGMDANVFNGNGMSTVGVATGYSKDHTKEEQLVLEDFLRSGALCAALIEHYAGGAAR